MGEKFPDAQAPSNAFFSSNALLQYNFQSNIKHISLIPFKHNRLLKHQPSTKNADSVQSVKYKKNQHIYYDFNNFICEVIVASDGLQCKRKQYYWFTVTKWRTDNAAVTRAKMIYFWYWHELIVCWTF